MNLPPLPTPEKHHLDAYGPVYTEAQMLALRAATVEACAKVCDEAAFYSDMHSRAFTQSSHKACADAIRSMK